MKIIKWFNCKYRNKHSMKVFKGKYLKGKSLCEVCYKSQDMIDNPEKYKATFDKIK